MAREWCLYVLKEIDERGKGWNVGNQVRLESGDEAETFCSCQWIEVTREQCLGWTKNILWKIIEVIKVCFIQGHKLAQL